METNTSQNKAFLFVKQIKKIKFITKILTKKEAVLIKFLIAAIVAAVILFSANWYKFHSYVGPADGGEYIEGIIGNPGLINPILAQTNEVDRDITRLLFNGLFKQQDTNIVPDLALTHTISEDGLTYTITLRKDVIWHDGNPFTASDVVFTIKAIQDPEYKSPLHSSLTGIAVKQENDYTVVFTLSQPFAPFLSLLTFGIIPKHIWEDVPTQNAHLADFNIKTPIGTGPFKIKSLKKDSRGVIKSYSLTRNENFYKQAPFIETITFKFYPDFESAIEALNNKNVDGLNYLPTKYHTDITHKDVSIQSLSLPQYSAVFFNARKNSTLDDINIRKALTHAVSREEIVQTALDEQAEAIFGPILPGFIGYDQNIIKYEYNKDTAISLIKKSGWKKISAEEYLATLENKSDKKIQTNATGPLEEQPETNPPNQVDQEFFWQKKDKVLSINLTTVDNPETIEVASLIKKQWQAVGVSVQTIIVSKEQLLAEVIKPRNYETLLFGQIIGNDPDPYAFWHSTQIHDPGVNLSLYKNKKVDALLEEARKTSDSKKRAEKYIEFQKILKQDLPAIFLYNPTYPYILHNKIKGFRVSRIANPADRFNGIEKWYIKTKRRLQLNKQNNLQSDSR